MYMVKIFRNFAIASSGSANQMVGAGVEVPCCLDAIETFMRGLIGGLWPERWRGKAGERRRAGRSANREQADEEV